MTWSDWPTKRDPRRGTFAACVIVACTLVIAYFDLLLATVGLLALLGACSEVLLPTRYRLTDEGIEVKSVFRYFARPWTRYRRWTETTDGFWLEYRSPVGILRRRRSIWLRCPGHEDAVKALLVTHLGDAVSPKGAQ